jgi:hypothetical protein
MLKAIGCRIKMTQHKYISFFAWLNNNEVLFYGLYLW